MVIILTLPDTGINTQPESAVEALVRLLMGLASTRITPMPPERPTGAHSGHRRWHRMAADLEVLDD